jgi:glyoxylase-like metal-dependent hydrolase (beta-lactamase superfamily II)
MARTREGGDALSRLRVGKAEVVLLDDTIVRFPVPLDQLFPNAPADGWAPFRQRFPASFDDATTPRAPMRCYVVRSEGRTILVDTGLGPAGTSFASFVGTGGALPERLAAEGIAPAQIDTVAFTHLQPDHVGWSLAGEPGGHRPASRTPATSRPKPTGGPCRCSSRSCPGRTSI